MSAECMVWTDVGGKLRRVGRAGAGRVGEFNYVDPYLYAAYPSIDPINLPTLREVFRTRANDGVWGVLQDAGPDGWGRRVMKTLDPEWFGTANGLDVLLRSSGFGVGSLMFSENADKRPRRQRGVRRADLAAAAEGAHEVELGEIPAAHLRELLQASISAGGIHPKVAVTDDNGSEWIAKFRSVEDIVDTPRVEFASMRLAQTCGIDTAEVELSAMGERSTLLVRRFDREHGVEHYASAHALFNRATIVAGQAGGWASYAGVLQLRQRLPGEGVRDDARELFRRMVFNVIIGNTDDHARNHGFLMDAAGAWRLSRAFDVLPSFRNQAQHHALDVGPRGTERSFENVMAGAAQFGLDAGAAAGVIRDIADRVRADYQSLLEQARCAPADRDVTLARCLFPPADL